ncbi:hypothetical protein RRG08_041194 [Elysia crispata]|uniref:Uncharacterized protein n=1 Tax=Elysia crispata TaxID=231223 RepID=A0AAE1CP26_9GAST|nr:hypothetical protein RRG08_041194 [Elysia crispata]
MKVAASPASVLGKRRHKMNLAPLTNGEVICRDRAERVSPDRQISMLQYHPESQQLDRSGRSREAIVVCWTARCGQLEVAGAGLANSFHLTRGFSQCGH